MDRNEQGPSEKLLQYIKWQGTDVLRMMFNTAMGMMHAVNEYSIAVPRMTAKINDHYREQCQIRVCVRSPHVGTIIDLVIWELLLNAAEHGNQWDQHKKICVMVWRGDEGIVIGCRDEGEFFKQGEIKEKFETRQRIHEKDKICRGKGTRFVYANADVIEVDVQTGTIFLSISYF